MFIRFDAIHERDGRTDGRTDGQTDGQTDIGVNFVQIVGGGVHGPFLPLPSPSLHSPPFPSPLLPPLPSLSLCSLPLPSPPSLPLSLEVGPLKSS